MVIQKGQVLNPRGRPKGARMTAINLIYSIFNKYGKKGFTRQLKDFVERNPVAYYLKFIQPIQPKDISFLTDNPDVKSIDITINKTYKNEIKKLGIIEPDGNNSDSKTD